MKFAIIGAMGRMGQAIANLSVKHPELQLTTAIEQKEHPHLGQHYGKLLSNYDIDIPLIAMEDIAHHDLEGIIDFSSPTSTIQILEYALNYNIPVVVGTTGMLSEQSALMKTYSKRIPILYSSNMSLGVNMLFYLTRKCANILEKFSFEPEIIEKHHKLKKDSPSGTAHTLASIILEEYGWLEKDIVHGREGHIKNKPVKELGMHAIRGGNIVGDHDVLFIQDNEYITLSHHASDRNVFAVGALQALLFIQNQPPKLYHMLDVLEFDL